MKKHLKLMIDVILFKISTLNIRGLNESKALYLVDFYKKKRNRCVSAPTHIKSSYELEKIENVVYQYSCMFPLGETSRAKLIPVIFF